VLPMCRLWIFSVALTHFAPLIGEKSAPVMGLNDVFGRFRQVSEVVETRLAEAFESAKYANFATPARSEASERSTFQKFWSTAAEGQHSFANSRNLQNALASRIC
jgi:hypothetical protein